MVVTLLIGVLLWHERGRVVPTEFVSTGATGPRTDVLADGLEREHACTCAEVGSSWTANDVQHRTIRSGDSKDYSQVSHGLSTSAIAMMGLTCSCANESRANIQTVSRKTWNPPSLDGDELFDKLE